MPRQISNEELLLGRIPHPDQEIGNLFAFAQTFDGYEYWGDACSTIANLAAEYFRKHNKLPDGMTLADIRGCLFFQHRLMRNNEQMITLVIDDNIYEPDSNAGEKYMRYLVSRIREVLWAKKHKQKIDTLKSFLDLGIIDEDKLIKSLDSLNH